MSDKLQFELDNEFEDKNFASCFARSVVVNSQYKQIKSLDTSEFSKESRNLFNNVSLNLKKPCGRPEASQDAVRLRKNFRNNSFDDSRRLSCSSINSSRRTSICSTRRTISEIPVENIVNQSKIETLQWQLREVEKSRNMYKAVMKQVVTFLERAHQSLERIKITNPTVPRSKSEHQILLESTTSRNSSSIDDCTLLRDYSWNYYKKPEVSADELPPEKLSQEAFRLLRTAQSLLSTQEPNLAKIDSEPENDIEFLSQLAKEFPPQTPEQKVPQRTTSFSLSPKLIVPENEVKISTAFNRKLSLQLSEVRMKNSIRCLNKTFDSGRGSVAESEMDSCYSLQESFMDGKSKICKVPEKSNSPPAGSISSVEDESGFSSMTSFQDVGLPSVPMVDEVVSAKTVLLRSMLHNNTSSTLADQKHLDDDIKLWQKPVHQRWHSTPVEDAANNSAALKVLWV